MRSFREVTPDRLEALPNAIALTRIYFSSIYLLYIKLAVNRSIEGSFLEIRRSFIDFKINLADKVKNLGKDLDRFPLRVVFKMVLVSGDE
ncbi:hypothetical protein QE152_g9723 [Popillia japonica]|uniref:Uncharacterized protein n=1 Tax=Popillia japonica TaxID=7064 RepID=A0AAW1LU11_POPJA